MQLKNLPIYLDVDGCLTLDKKFYTEDGKILVKTFNDKDSYIIEWLKRNNIPVILISGDKRINEQWADYKNLPFVKASSYSDKYFDLKMDFKDRFNIFHDMKGDPAGKYFYLGDGVPDYKCLINAKIGYIPRNASLFLKNIEELDNIKFLKRNGGNGCLEELVKDLLERGYIQETAGIYA